MAMLGAIAGPVLAVLDDRLRGFVEFRWRFGLDVGAC
jgi:hypothetical protein